MRSDKNSYNPYPIDTSDIQLPDELNQLTELLAENVHELWAKLKTSQGWKYGLEQSKKNKTHPNLVPYADLTESEKEYDRTVFIESIKAILKLGFRIDKN